MNLLLFAGIVFGVVIVGMALTHWWSSARKVALSPPVVHILVGETVTVQAIAIRKRARSRTYYMSANSRTFKFTAASGHFNVNPASTTPNAQGLAKVQLNGLLAGKSSIICEAGSSRSNKKYGPNTFDVHVYAKAADVPANVKLTSVAHPGF